MVYLDPRSDIAFKKLFGNMAHKNILISFLNSILARTDQEQIVDVVVNDPANIPDTTSQKSTIVDVRCTDQNGQQYIVEMQVVTQKDYAARAQYYSALALSKQLPPRGRYEELVPVFFIGVLDFALFDGPAYLTHHLILDTKTHRQVLKHFEFHFIELSKFHKTLNQLTNDQDKWVFFLKNASELSSVPAPLQQPGFTDAFDLLAQSNWNNQELLQYEKYLDIWRSHESQLAAAVERGIAEGEKKGEKIGQQKGEKRKALAIAAALLDILDIETIAAKTGLTVAEVTALKKL